MAMYGCTDGDMTSDVCVGMQCKRSGDGFAAVRIRQGMTHDRLAALPYVNSNCHSTLNMNGQNPLVLMVANMAHRHMMRPS